MSQRNKNNKTSEKKNPTMIFSTSGHLIYSNPECRELVELFHKYSIGSGRTIHLTDLFDNNSPITTAISDIINTQLHTLEINYISQDTRDFIIQFEALSSNIPSDVLVRFIDASRPGESKTEKEWVRKETCYRDLFEDILHGAFYQSADGTLIDVNPAALELFGLTKEQFLKKKSSDEYWNVINEDGTLTRPEDYPSMKAFKTAKPVKNIILGVHNPKKEDYVWLNISAIPQFKKEDKKPYQVFVTLTDITDQKKAEIELLEKDRWLESIFRALPAGVGIVSKRYLLEVNEHLCKMIGYTRDELVGQPARLLYPSDEHYEFVGTEKYRQINEKGIGTVETRWKHKDGSVIDIILSSSPIDRNDLTKGVTFTAIDISDRKRSEERILHLTRILRSIRDVNQLIVKEKEHDRLLKEICKTLTENQGYNSSWICLFDVMKKIKLIEESGPGESFRNLNFESGNLPVCVQMLQSEKYDIIKLKPFEDCTNCPLNCINEDSVVLGTSLNYKGKLYGMLAASLPSQMADDYEVLKLFKEVAEDISFALYNLELEELQKQSTELLSNILDAIPDLVWVKDKNGKYITCNPRFESFFGAKKEEIEGKTDYDFVDKELADFFTNKDRIAMNSDRPSVNEEEIPFASDGHHEILETIKTPIYDINNEPIGVLGIGRDITQRKNLEQILLQSKEIAENATRTKSEFLANMSHELRTPLNSIIGFAQILDERMYGDINGKQMKYIQNILKSSKHLLTLINDVLDISRIESGNMEFNPEITDIPETINEIKDLIEPLAKIKNITIATTINLKYNKIILDKIKFKDILYNLLSNSIKFTGENGNIKIISQTNQSEIQTSISDTGIGISEKYLDLIFEPFKQTDSFLTRKYSGTGLGLALVKHYVEMHGGSIKVESEVNFGSTFTFTIPLNLNARS